MFKWFGSKNENRNSNNIVTDKEKQLLEKLDKWSSEYPRYNGTVNVKNGQISMVKSSEEEQ